MTSTPTVVRIRAICIDHARTISTKAVFPVDMPFISQNGLETEVYHLVEKVLASPSPLVIANATVWKLKDPKPLRSFGPKTRSQTQVNVNDVQQYIHNLDFSTQAEELKFQDKIKDLFNPDSMRSLYLHVIIQLPDQNKRQREIANDAGDDEPPSKTFKILNRRDDALEEAKAATRSAYPSTINAVNKIYSTIYGSHPTRYYDFPPSLYHPALARLQYDLEASDSEEAETIASNNRDTFRRALEFYVTATESARNEDERWSKMQDFLVHIFGTEHRYEKPLANHSTALKPDVVWGEPTYTILELKTDPGVSGDATLQAVRAYIYDCSLRKGKKTVFPAILIGVMGNILEISTVVTPERLHYTKIFHLELLSNRNAKLVVRKLVRVALALRKCAGTLRKEYDTLNSPIPTQDQNNIQEKWYLPRPTLHPSCEHLKPNLTIECPLSRINGKVDEASPTPLCSLFLGVLNNKEAVVIKFTSDYNASAHNLLAKQEQQQLAPKLYGDYQLMGCGQMKMIIMERVDGIPMCEYDKHSLPASVFADIERAIELLHAEGLVFGDLRATNIMVVGEHAMLVDFDWVGRHNEDWYPPIINDALIGNEWHHGVQAQGQMQKDHDLWALEKIKGDYQKVTSD